MLEIWHNPRCSKSRETLRLIEESGVEHRIRRYLDDPPSARQLDDALRRLGMEPWDLARRREAVAQEIGLADLGRDRRAWIRAMVAHPILIERPVVLADDGGAVVGRPPDRVRKLLDRSDG